MSLNQIWLLTITLLLIGCSRSTTPSAIQIETNSTLPASAQHLVHNGTFVGGIPITSQPGGNVECIRFIENGDYAKVIGTSDKGNWILVDYYGHATGWIPEWMATSNTFDNEKFLLPIKSTEPQNTYQPKDDEVYIKAIKDFTNNSNIEPVFICYSPISDAPKRRAAVYADSLGGTYFVSVDIPQVVYFGSGRSQTIASLEGDFETFDYDSLDDFAANFATKHSKKFESYFEKMEINFHGKGDGDSYAYIYRGYLNKPCNGKPYKIIQIVFESNGRIISYKNTLDLACQ